MTKRNKLIVGGLVVLGALYLLNKYRVKKEVEKLKDGADVTPLVSENKTKIQPKDNLLKMDSEDLKSIQV